MRAQHGQGTVQPLGEFFGTANVKKELAGFSVSRMAPVIPAEEMQTHTHEQATFVMVLDGFYISSALNAGPRCRAPTLIYNPPGTTHRDRFEQLSGQFLGIAISSASLQHAVGYAPLPDRAVSIQSSTALSIGRRLGSLCDRLDDTSPLLAEGLCWELMGYAATASQRHERRPPTWLRTSKELLHERCNQTFGVADAAREVGVHPVHFVRTFRQFFHCTPGEYLRWCRIEKAKSLLTSSSLSLAEAALESGYTDQSQLSKAFKRYFGLSPGEYRRSCRHRRAQN
jgi:AraC family transcriptional regulator